MVFSQWLNTHRIFKRLAKALIRLRICAGWSYVLLVAHTRLLEISCRGSYVLFRRAEVCVICLFLTVPMFALWSVIVKFPGHTHLLFMKITNEFILKKGKTLGSDFMVLYLSYHNIFHELTVLWHNYCCCLVYPLIYMTRCPV